MVCSTERLSSVPGFLLKQWSGGWFEAHMQTDPQCTQHVPQTLFTTACPGQFWLPVNIHWAAWQQQIHTQFQGLVLAHHVQWWWWWMLSVAGWFVAVATEAAVRLTAAQDSSKFGVHHAAWLPCSSPSVSRNIPTAATWCHGCHNLAAAAAGSRLTGGYLALGHYTHVCRHRAPWCAGDTCKVQGAAMTR